MKYLRIFEWASVVVVSTAMFIYGFAKPIQFTDPSTITTPVNELTGMQLMWAFYGYSLTMPLFLGLVEVAGGILLILPRTRVIGAIILTGILSTVIMQDVIYGVLAGALKAAIVYLILTLAILFIHREVAIDGFKRLLLPKPEERPTMMFVVLVLLLAALIKFLEVLWTHGV